MVRTADEPLVDEAVLRAGRAHDDVDVVGFNAFGQDGSLRVVEGLLHVAADFREFFRETDDLVVAGTFPLFVLRRMAFAALLRAHEVVREIEEGFVRQTIVTATLRPVSAWYLSPPPNSTHSSLRSDIVNLPTTRPSLRYLK